MPNNEELIAQLYIGYFNRAPDPQGLDYWLGRMAAGVPLADIADSFAASPEAIANYPFFAFPNLVNSRQFLGRIYHNLFGRDIDADGLTYYSGKLASGATPVGAIIVEILGNAATNDGSSDQIYLHNKVEVGLDWALAAAGVEGFRYDRAGASGRAAHDAIADVDDTPQSVAAAKAATAAFFAGASPAEPNEPVPGGGGIPGGGGGSPGDGGAGKTVMLTTAVDNLTGTAGNDLFKGVYSGGSPIVDGTTFSSGDTIGGKGGYNTLSVLVTASGPPVIPTLTNIQNIEIQALADFDLSLINSTGVQRVELTGLYGKKVEISGVKSIFDLALTDFAGSGRVYYQSEAVSGTNDVQNIVLSNYFNVPGDPLEIDNVEFVNVDSKTASWLEQNSLYFKGDSVKTVNVTGAAPLVIFVSGPAFHTLDAAASTGNIAVYVDNANGPLALRGGSGDNFFLYYRDITPDDHVDGGAGFNTLALSGGDYRAAANPVVKSLNATTSIQQIWFSGPDDVLIDHDTLTNADLETIRFTSADGDVTVDHALSSIDYGFGGSEKTVTFDMAAGNVELNLHLGVTGGDEPVSVNSIFGQAQTINLSSDGDFASGANTISQNIFNANGATVNITGEAALTISGLFAYATIDASAFTGDLVVAGSGANAGQADIIKLGSGVDTVNVAGGKSGHVSGGEIDADSIDAIHNFATGDGGDRLNWTDLGDNVYAAIAAATQDEIDNAVTLTAAARLAATGQAVSHWTAFEFEGQTYALHVFAPDAFITLTDAVVLLVGVSVADLSQANFGA